MAKDIMFDDDGDLAFKLGDIIVQDSRYQHVQDLLLAKKGYYKFDPETGVDLEAEINAELDQVTLMKKVRAGLEDDGFVVDVLYVQADGKLRVDGDYNS